MAKALNSLAETGSELRAFCGHLNVNAALIIDWRKAVRTRASQLATKPTAKLQAREPNSTQLINILPGESLSKQWVHVGRWLCVRVAVEVGVALTQGHAALNGDDDDDDDATVASRYSWYMVVVVEAAAR